MSFGIRTPMKSKLTSMQAVQYRQEHENPTLSSTTVDSTSSTEPKLGSLYDNDDHNNHLFVAVFLLKKFLELFFSFFLDMDE